ncbi:MAG TPA: hypothetical protein VN768_06790 [Acidimicrobiales bacterium]|nr:hypothetical protein [Acidimicrobiales bacterium]
MLAVMRSMIQKTRRLTGTGAVDNAQRELDRTVRSVVELDRQLQRVREPDPRRAA